MHTLHYTHKQTTIASQTIITCPVYLRRDSESHRRGERCRCWWRRQQITHLHTHALCPLNMMLKGKSARGHSLCQDTHRRHQHRPDPPRSNRECRRCRTGRASVFFLLRKRKEQRTSQNCFFFGHARCVALRMRMQELAGNGKVPAFQTWPIHL